MKIEKLYSIMGLKPYVEPARPKIIYIVSGNHRELFKAAADSISQNHTRTHSVSYSQYMITEYVDNVAKSYTSFLGSANTERLRGCTIDTLIIDDNVGSELRYIKSCLGPAAKEIIYIDNLNEVE
jgi:hypothetical protein